MPLEQTVCLGLCGVTASDAMDRRVVMWWFSCDSTQGQIQCGRYCMWWSPMDILLQCWTMNMFAWWLTFRLACAKQCQCQTRILMCQMATGMCQLMCKCVPDTFSHDVTRSVCQSHHNNMSTYNQSLLQAYWAVVECTFVCSYQVTLSTKI